MLKKRFFILSVLIFLVSFSYAKTVRTGYLNYDDDFMKGSVDSSPKGGYGYDYIQQVATYTGWQYEYVYGNWTQLYNMLVNGDIDVLADVSCSRDREDKMYFPDFSMGEEKYNIYILPENETIKSDNLMSLNGKKIGIITDVISNQYLAEWISKNHLNVEIFYYMDDESRNEDFLSGKLDAIVEVDLNKTYDWEPVFTIGGSKFYLAVSIQRPDLIKELNDALTEIYARMPHYNDRLYAKYYYQLTGSQRLEEDESDWIKTHTVLNVGCYNNFLPFCDYDVISGHTKGFARDLFNLLFEELGVLDIKINLIFYSDTQKAMEALKKKEIDCLFPSFSSLWITEKLGLLQSENIASASMNLLYKGSFTEETESKIAVSNDNPLQVYYVQQNFPRSEIVYYDTTEKALNAVLRGKCGCTVLNGFKSQYYKSRQKGYSKLNVLELSTSGDFCLLFVKDNSGLLHLINRGISLVPESFVSRSLENYWAEGLIYTRKDFISDNLEIIVIVLVFIIILAGALIVVSDKLKMYVIYDPLTHLMNRKTMNQHLNSVYKQASAGKGSFTLLLLDLDDFKKVNDSYGHNCGDAVLQYVANAVSRGVKKDDYVFRWGGEEILVVLRTEKEIALKVAERIRFDISKEPVKYKELKIPVTVTIGTSVFNPGVSLKDMFEEADRNLYTGKNHGKNQVVIS